MAAFFRKALTQREFEVLSERIDSLMDTVVVGKAKRPVSRTQAQEMALDSEDYKSLRAGRANTAH